MITLYGIKNCDTVRKACRWLDAENIDYQFHDFKKQGIDAELATHWIKVLGLDTVINRRGTTYRKLDEETKAKLTDATAIAVIQQNPSVVKRPVLANGQQLFVGFSDDKYREIFSA